MADKSAEQQTEKHQPESSAHECQHHQRTMPNILAMVMLLAGASSMVVYVYHVEQRVYSLQQSVDVIASCRCTPAVARDQPPLSGIGPSSSEHTKLQSSMSSSTTTISSSSPSSTSSVPASSSSTTSDWMWWFLSRNNNKIPSTRDEEKDDINYFNYDTEVSGTRGLEDDEDTYTDYSGDEDASSSSWSHDWSFLQPHSRGKRSVDDFVDLPQSDAAPAPDPARRQHNHGQRRHHGRQQHQQQADAEEGERGTATVKDLTAAGNGRRQSRRGRHERPRRERTRTRAGRRRNHHHHQSQGDVALDQQVATGVKAAHFIAPRGPEKHFTSGSQPPATFPFWKADNWTSNSTSWFQLGEGGIVTVLESGLYMVYAQLVYHDLSGRWSFGIYVSDRQRVKCMNTEQMDGMRSHQSDQSASASSSSSSQSSSSSHGVYQHCYTSAVLALSRYDAVSIRCLYGSRAVVMQPEFTFWGLVRLAPHND